MISVLKTLPSGTLYAVGCAIWLMKRAITILELPVTNFVINKYARLAYLQITSKQIQSVDIQWND
jgi:hypothetical protein